MLKASSVLKAMLFALMIASAALAQTQTATVRGVVRDNVGLALR
jgi:hypothetical protein